jgi:hypothetical protein
MYKSYLATLTASTILLLVSFGGQSKEIKVVTELLEPYQIKKPDGTLGGF